MISPPLPLVLLFELGVFGASAGGWLRRGVSKDDVEQALARIGQ
jgi:hypothetical protein